MRSRQPSRTTARITQQPPQLLIPAVLTVRSSSRGMGGLGPRRITSGNCLLYTSGWIRAHGGIGLFNQPANPYPGQIPVFQWARAVERGTEFDREHDGLTGVSRLESNIKLILNLAGNTLVNQHSDINQNTRLLRDETKCEFILCSDLFMTPSARYADLLLPATSVFEGNNIVNPWIGGRYLLRNNQVIEPLFGCRFEWEWLKEVADRLGYYREFVDGKEETESWLRENYEILRRREPELPDYETFSAAGGWRYRDGRVRVAFREQIADPENHPFPTRSGKIEIVSPDLSLSLIHIFASG